MSVSRLTRLTPMHGFTAAVAHADDRLPHQSAGVAVGASGDADDRRFAIALRHADGTTLTCSMTEAGIDRLARLLAELVDAPPAFGALVTLQ